MCILAMIIILGAYIGLLILQTVQNCDISFTEEEKAAMKAAVKAAVRKFIGLIGRLRHGVSNK